MRAYQKAEAKITAMVEAKFNVAVIVTSLTDTLEVRPQQGRHSEAEISAFLSWAGGPARGRTPEAAAGAFMGLWGAWLDWRRTHRVLPPGAPVLVDELPGEDLFQVFRGERPSPKGLLALAVVRLVRADHGPSNWRLRWNIDEQAFTMSHDLASFRYLCPEAAKHLDAMAAAGRFNIT